MFFLFFDCFTAGEFCKLLEFQKVFFFKIRGLYKILFPKFVYDNEFAGFTVGFSINFSNKPAAVNYRKAKIAELSFSGWNVALYYIVKPEQCIKPLSLNNNIIKR